MISTANLVVNNKTFIKDPLSSDLGKRIIRSSIDLIHEIGFEQFNFKKLGQEINSPEASIYRYFESKHKLLLYLTSWYWTWMQSKVQLSILNIDSKEDQLLRAINVLTEKIIEDTNFSHINEVKLQQIVFSESPKVYLTKDVDTENKIGLFSAYKSLVELVSGLVTSVNPGYKYPQMLISTIIESIQHQRYFADHLPKLTNRIEGEDAIKVFFHDLINKTVLNK